MDCLILAFLSISAATTIKNHRSWLLCGRCRWWGKICKMGSLLTFGFGKWVHRFWVLVDFWFKWLLGFSWGFDLGWFPWIFWFGVFYFEKEAFNFIKWRYQSWLEFDGIHRCYIIFVFLDFFFLLVNFCWAKIHCFTYSFLWLNFCIFFLYAKF